MSNEASNEIGDDQILDDDQGRPAGDYAEDDHEDAAAINEDDAPGADDEDTNDEDAGDVEPKKKSNGKIIKLAIVVAAVVLIAGLGAIFMGGKGTPQPEYPPPQEDTHQAAPDEFAPPESASDEFAPPESAPASMGGQSQGAARQEVDQKVFEQPGAASPGAASSVGAAPAIDQQIQENMIAAQKAIIDEIDSLRKRVASLEKEVGKMKEPFYRTKKKAKKAESVSGKKAKEVAAKDAPPAPAAENGTSPNPIVAVGRVETPSITVAPISTKAVELSSDVFTLKGVLAGMAWVVYQSDGKMYIVRVGDKLPNGAIVQRIDAIRHYVGTTLGGIQ